MPKVIMYSTGLCRFCMMAEQLLSKRGIEHIEKMRVDLYPELRQEMIDRTQRRTVPQIYINDIHIGGFDDLAKLDRKGELERLLALP